MDLGVLTVTIAAIVTIITLGQWLTARNNIKQQLFEKRYEVYERITGFIADIQIQGRVPVGREFEFLRETKRAYFLFAGDKDVNDLISEIYNKAADLHALESELEGTTGDDQGQSGATETDKGLDADDT